MAVKYSLMVSTSVCTLKTLTSVLPLCFPLLRGFFEVSWGKEEVAALSHIPGGAACPDTVGEEVISRL